MAIFISLFLYHLIHGILQEWNPYVLKLCFYFKANMCSALALQKLRAHHLVRVRFMTADKWYEQPL